MLGRILKLFDSNDKEIKNLSPLIQQINALGDEMKELEDKDFAMQTDKFRERIKQGESLDFLMPEAFALVREAAHRSIGQKHYDVQLMAAATLAWGKIAEQKTGEGKTLSATPALYLHALTGNSVHLVTVNDYLARRDAGWMGPVFHLLGMRVGAIINEKSYIFDHQFTNPDAHDFRLLHLKEVTRKEAYQADVVYGINSEFGFDYLRDNMADNINQLVQRGHYYAIVDEVDSVLIDEARTPHIISAPKEEPTDKYYEYARAIEKLSAENDYKLDEKQKTAHLTEEGIAKIENMYGVKNIYEKDFDTVYHLEAALKAKTLFHRERDYIVRDGEVILVDEFTGRLMVGRRLSEGLHQAIEAKEGVAIQRESRTLATVSLQNYFRMYERLAGMTGTAVTEAEEFHKIYKLDVVMIPTHRQVSRVDHPDAVYKTQQAKYNAIVAEVAKAHERGQPVLVGTTAIDKNEIVSQLLKKKGIKHEVLNAKNHEREADIIAMAGVKGAVTVATNMAGRGVDIILGGDTPKNDDGSTKQNSKEYKAWEKRHNEVLALGGLYIIGTERHESRRIDNQLRGRAGRQGDPGTSQFFVALDDDIMRLFGGDTIAGLMTRFNLPEDVPLSHGLVSRAIEQAQVKVEGFNFDIRKHLVDYDDVLNKQREIIYQMRRTVLEATPEDTTLATQMKERADKSIENIVTMRVVESYQAGTNESNKNIIEDFVTIVPFDPESQQQLIMQLESRHEPNEKIEFLQSIARDVYMQREKSFGPAISRQIEQFVLLSVIDMFWMDHLDAIENLRQGIGLRGYGQRDPLVEYKNEAFRMFEMLVASINDEAVHRIFKIQVQGQSHEHAVVHTHEHDHPAHTHEEPQEPKEMNMKAPKVESPIKKALDQAKKPTTEIKKTRPGRNDPCWCGSSKKFKKCHYPQVPA